MKLVKGKDPKAHKTFHLSEKLVKTLSVFAILFVVLTLLCIGGSAYCHEKAEESTAVTVVGDEDDNNTSKLLEALESSKISVASEEEISRQQSYQRLFYLGGGCSIAFGLCAALLIGICLVQNKKNQEEKGTEEKRYIN